MDQCLRKSLFPYSPLFHAHLLHCILFPLLLSSGLTRSTHLPTSTEPSSTTAAVNFGADQAVVGLAQYERLVAFFISNRTSIPKENVDGGDHYISIYKGAEGLDTGQALKELISIPVGELAATDSLLDFQFGGKSSLFFCTTLECRVCFFESSKSTTTRCQHIPLETVGGFSTVKGAYSPSEGRLFLRGISFKDPHHSAGIYAFDVPTTNDGHLAASTAPMGGVGPDKYAWDHEIVAAFTDAKYVYFLGSATRPDIPNKINKNKPLRNRTDIRLTRVCLADGSRELESRIDIALSCAGTDLSYDTVTPHRAKAASLSADHRWLLVALTNETSQLVCKFEMRVLKNAFETVWKSCQAIENARDVANRCPDESADLAACFLISWERNVQYPICQRFNKGGSSHEWDNCELGNSKIRTDRLGWLENYNYTRGQTILALDTSAPAISAVHESPVEGDSTAIFLTFADGHAERRLLSRTHVTTSPTRPLWRTAVATHDGLPLFQPMPAGRLLYSSDASDHTSSVRIVDVNCAGLYPSCSDIQWQDPLSCGWCAAKNSREAGKTIEYGRVPTECYDGQQLRNVCPPTVDFLSDGGEGPITIVGNNLEKLENPQIEYCGRKCEVDDVKTNVMLCTPTHRSLTVRLTNNNDSSGNESRRETFCDAVIEGKVGPVTNFKLIHEHKLGGPVPRRPPDADQKPWDSARYIRAILLGTTILICLCFLLLIWFCGYKKYGERLGSKLNLSGTGSKSGRNHLQHRHHLSSSSSRNTLSYKYLSNAAEQPVFMSADEMGCGDLDSPSSSQPFGSRQQLAGGSFGATGAINKLQSQQVRFVRPIGEGHSSKVHLAVLRLGTSRGDKDEEQYVAVKTVTNSDFASQDIMREIELIAQCHHENIVGYVGYYWTGFGVHIVTEFMAGGDLHKFLLDETNKLTIGNAFTYIMNICEGMNYLTHRHIVHRDLAARNCMLDENHSIVKITDFGLCRVSNKDYEYISENSAQQLPFRWTALECFGSESRFSEKSDVWSFGVVVWEIFARNLLPYEEITDSTKLRDFLTEGNRLPHIQPELTPKQLYDNVMVRCWETSPGNRPTFEELRQTILDIYYYLASMRPGDLSTEYETPITSVQTSVEVPQNPPTTSSSTTMESGTT